LTARRQQQLCDVNGNELVWLLLLLLLLMLPLILWLQFNQLKMN